MDNGQFVCGSVHHLNKLLKAKAPMVNPSRANRLQKENVSSVTCNIDMFYYIIQKIWKLKLSGGASRSVEKKENTDFTEAEASPHVAALDLEELHQKCPIQC